MTPRQARRQATGAVPAATVLPGDAGDRPVPFGPDPAPRPAPMRPPPQPGHPFAGLTPGTVVHFVTQARECRGAFVVHLQRAKGRLIAVTPEDDGHEEQAAVLRQQWLLPDGGSCALQVELHPLFDRDEVAGVDSQPGRSFRESVSYAPAAEWQEDAQPCTWHWLSDHG